MDTEADGLGERFGEVPEVQDCQSRPCQGAAAGEVREVRSDQIAVNTVGDAGPDHGARRLGGERSGHAGAGDHPDEPSRDERHPSDTYRRLGGARVTRTARDLARFTALPSLDDLADDPVRAAGLTLDAARALFTRASTVQSALLGRLVSDLHRQSVAAENDEILGVKEAAHAIGKSADWMYRHADTLPFTVHIGRSLRFSRLGLQRWLRTRQGR